MARTRVSASPQKKQSVAPKIKPTQEEIALRAYHIYLERSCTPGNAFDDWVRAERELVENNGKPRRKPAPKSAAA
ncbi:MAG: DUF2934 domain-containing protein [Candidatus Acidiferrales bacterium]